MGSANGLISIIVPVYNALVTLERCVQSILSQTYRNLEVILVDDASTDASRELMMRLEQSDPERIMVICNDDNAGPGGARNIGLSYANGDYIGFVDSDDYIQSAMYEKLVAELERGGHDFVDCGYFNESKDNAMLNTGRDTRGILTPAQKCELIVSGGYLWSRLFKRELFEEAGIIFRENCILEDSEVLVSLIANAKSVGAVEETLYWYSKTDGSESVRHSGASYIENICGAMTALASLYEKAEMYNELKSAIDYEIMQMYDFGVVMALKEARSGHGSDALTYLAELRDIRLQGASAGYSNKYVQNKIKREDMELMKQNLQ